MGEILLTVDQVAKILLVSKSTVYRYAENNALPHIKKKFGLRFMRNDLEAWLGQDKRKTRSPDITITKNLTFPPPPRLVSRGGFDGLAKDIKPRSIKNRFNLGFGAIYQRPNKRGGMRWYLDFRNARGERVQQVAPLAQTKEEAVLALQEEIRKEFDAEYQVKRQREKTIFSELASLYLEDYAKQNKRSWRSDFYIIQAHMKPYFGENELSDITPLMIEKYRAIRLKTGVTKSTVNRELCILKKMFHLARDWNLTDQNPVLKVRLFPEKDNVKERILGDDEEEKLRAGCPDYLKPIIITALNTGMRRGEILQLKWSQVDLEKRIIRVEKTKSGKTRIIPINDVLYRELLKAGSSMGKGDFVFSNPKTGKPFVEVKRSFKSTCRNLGIQNLRFHDLRHTFATRLIRSGVDIITVKELLGHHSVKITQRYTHSNHDQKRNAVDLLAKRDSQNGDNEAVLLHSCYTADDTKKANRVNDRYSIN